jgi:hypothetical protein
MKCAVCAIRPDLKKTIQHEMRAVVQAIRSEKDETTACDEATETKPDPGTMQSVEEHQEIPKEEATVMPAGGLRKRRRGRNLAAGRRQKPKGTIRASCESSRRFTVAGRKVSRRAAVARRKRNVFRKIGIRRMCGLRKRLTAARIKMTRHARVAWRREHFVRKDCTRTKDERATQRVGPLRRNLRMHHKGKCGTKDLCGGQPLYLRKERATTNGIEGWSSGHQAHLGRAGTLKMILYAIFRRKIVKGTSSWLWKIRKWILWRGRPPSKRKKRSHTK